MYANLPESTNSGTPPLQHAFELGGGCHWCLPQNSLKTDHFLRLRGIFCIAEVKANQTVCVRLETIRENTNGCGSQADASTKSKELRRLFFFHANDFALQKVKPHIATQSKSVPWYSWAKGGPGRFEIQNGLWKAITDTTRRLTWRNLRKGLKGLIFWVWVKV